VLSILILRRNSPISTVHIRCLSTALHNLSLAAAGGSAAATRALEQAQDADYESQNLEIHQVPSKQKQQ
jgi:hypothetical protein